MNRDIILIEAVRQKPCLYVDNFNIEERNKGWKQLSETLQVNDQLLKIRWHLLVQRYQKDTGFKYAQYMNFVERINNKKTEQRNWPEFEITEGDLENIGKNSEEYIFLDVEDLETEANLEIKTGTQIEVESGENRNDEEEHNISLLLASPKNELRQNRENTIKLEISTDISQSKGIKETSKNTTRCISPISKTQANVEEERRISTIPLNSPAIRSEDDIFGELVAAMLKRMDSDKKRMVKKEIMNMLLT